MKWHRQLLSTRAVSIVVSLALLQAESTLLAQSIALRDTATVSGVQGRLSPASLESQTRPLEAAVAAALADSHARRLAEPARARQQQARSSTSKSGAVKWILIAAAGAGGAIAALAFLRNTDEEGDAATITVGMPVIGAPQ